MNLKLSKFCSLATSASWQTWLFNTNKSLYQRFIKRLHLSKGCSQNKEIMQDILNEIESSGLQIELMKYLSSEHPDIIKNPNQISQTLINDLVFGYYNPGIITYPRRIILSGDNLGSIAESFIKDKLESEYIIISNKVYIEYLLITDENIREKLPANNWKIRAFKNGKETST